jgi:hypothetical protein
VGVDIDDILAVDVDDRLSHKEKKGPPLCVFFLLSVINNNNDLIYNIHGIIPLDG